jgi:glycosyltransferase involved in cell wall biosynthesis
MVKIGISFVIPAFNEVKYINSCVNSIITEAKKYYRWEVIVVDNNSTDGTKAYVPFEAKLIYEEKQGLVWARKRGLEATKYRYVAFIDADCIMPEGWAEAALCAVMQPGVVAASGPLHYYDAPKYVNWGTNSFYKVARYLHNKWPTLQGGNFIVDKEALLSVGGFDPTIQFYGEDTMTAVKLSQVGRVVMEPAMWINSSARRLNNQGVVNTVSTYIANYFAVNLIHKPVTNTHKDYR